MLLTCFDDDLVIIFKKYLIKKKKIFLFAFVLAGRRQIQHSYSSSFSCSLFEIILLVIDACYWFSIKFESKEDNWSNSINSIFDLVGGVVLIVASLKASASNLLVGLERNACWQFDISANILCCLALAFNLLDFNNSDSVSVFVTRLVLFFRLDDVVGSTKTDCLLLLSLLLLRVVSFFLFKLFKVSRLFAILRRLLSQDNVDFFKRL